MDQELFELARQRIAAYFTVLENDDEKNTLEALKTDSAYKQRLLKWEGEGEHPSKTWTAFILGLHRSSPLRWIAKALILGPLPDANREDIEIWQRTSDWFQIPPVEIPLEEEEQTVTPVVRVLGKDHWRVQRMQYYVQSH